MRRRDVIQSFAAASLSAILPHTGNAAEGDAFYDVGRFGNARVLHLTDTHAQLLPVYFREPSVNIGVGSMAGQPPHLVGRAFLDHFGIKASDREAYALTFLDYRDAAHRFGRMGGFAHLKTLIDRLRAEAGSGHSVLLDGGDLWQGSGLANATDGAAMVEVANLLGIEAMTGHWEFTYGEKILRQNLKDFKGEFLAQNVFLTDEAAFNNAPAFDAASGRVFKPATIKELGGYRVGIVGQAMPYVPIAHPKRFTPDWTFGIRDAELQKVVDGLRQHDKVDAVLLLSHNGMDVDLKLASRVTGIDVILGGHTHDAVPRPTVVTNASRQDAGNECRIERKISRRARSRSRQRARQGRALPAGTGVCRSVAAEPHHAGSDRSAARALHAKICRKARDRRHAALSARQFYRPDGSGDLRCAARDLGAQIALSPGFRFGTTVLAGAPIAMEDLLTETAITYPQSYVTDMTGGQIKDILEDIADNLFNPDPYYQQGGDMVRVGGMDYACAPAERIGQPDFGHDTERRHRHGSRQELSRRRLGLGQSADRQAGHGRRGGLSARQESRETYAAPIVLRSKA